MISSCTSTYKIRYEGWLLFVATNVKSCRFLIIDSIFSCFLNGLILCSRLQPPRSPVATWDEQELWSPFTSGLLHDHSTYKPLHMYMGTCCLTWSEPWQVWPVLQTYVCNVRNICNVDFYAIDFDVVFPLLCFYSIFWFLW
jgi:hypothetical protein